MESEIVLADIVPSTEKPWGFWSTLGLSLVVLGVFLLIQGVVSIAFAVVLQMRSDANVDPTWIADLGMNGLLLSVSAWAAFPFAIGLIALFVRIRKPWSLRDYLALHPVRIRTLLLWCGIVVLYGAAYTVAATISERVVVQNMMVELYRTAGSALLFWLALTVEAPLFEEIFFRGFMFRGIQQSRAGTAGAIFLTSLIWTMIHVQYEAPELLYVFGLGLLMGIARWKSGSTCLTIVMHALINFVAMVEVECLIARAP